MNCPVCQQVKLTPAFSVAGHAIADCNTCGHRFVPQRPDSSHLDDVYGDDYFFGGGDGYADYFEESDLLIERGRTYHELLRPFVGSEAHLLDVGAAAGFVLQGLLNHGAWTGQGVEPNERMATYGRDTLGLDITTSPLERLDSERKFDVVTCIQVLPHFYDLEVALESVARLTRTTGHLLVETWDKESKTARLFGKSWHEYSPPSVLHWFSPNTLDQLLRRYGFERVAKGRPSRKLSAGHAKSLLSHKLKGSKLATPFGKLTSVISDSWSVPYPGDDLFWALYRRG